MHGQPLIFNTSNIITFEFVDINSDTVNINPKEVEKSINNDTKAILAVNLLGNPADYDALRSLATNIILFYLKTIVRVLVPQ